MPSDATKRRLACLALLVAGQAAALPACFGPETTRCPSGVICPPGLRCHPTSGGCYDPDRSGCGNGLVEAELGEACDDGNSVDGDGCSANCQSLEECGNGVVDTTIGEECDDGNHDNDDGCSATCRRERCGDALVQPGEACDDGNNVSGDGCRADCRSDETCGNGEIDVVHGERCDDGNRRSLDGCSSDCQPEQAVWTQTVFPGPVNRTLHAAAYDAVRDRVVLFGGEASGVLLGDTWEFDGVRWVRRVVPAAPAPRHFHAMGYHAASGRTILYGGRTSASDAIGDTWAFDGTSWSEITTGPAPPARFDHAMTYDASRQRLVMAGGISRVGDLAGWPDTWEFDGTGWSEATPAAPFPRRLGHAMAYDASGLRVIAFGGKRPAATFGEPPSAQTWSYDGTTWQQLGPSASPPGLYRPALSGGAASGALILVGGVDAFQARDGVWRFASGSWTQFAAGAVPPARSGATLSGKPGGGALLFGGQDGLLRYDDTWRLDGATWSAVVPSNGPSRRRHAAAAFDSARGVVYILFGERTGPGSTVVDREQWRHDGTYWEPLQPPGPGPEPRSRAALAYDEARDRLVLFGGAVHRLNPSRTEARGDTWELVGGAWQRRQPPVDPGARADAAMVYDADRGEMILYGGTPYDLGSVFSDTWRYDGTTWTPVATVTDPGPRTRHALAYDRARRRVVLFGGVLADNTPGTFVADTWELVDGSWAERSPGPSPSPRADPVMVYDPLRELIVLVGGGTNQSASSDVWEWDGRRWLERPPFLAPPAPRRAAAGAFDTARRVLVLLGGVQYDQAGLGFTSDEAWQYGFQGPQPTEQCQNGLDDDGDLQIDCDDPDCNASPACPAPENCLNGSDDDGDGEPDATDPNCGGRACNGWGAYWRAGECYCPGGTAEDCQNGIDDDCDGKIDRADDECP